MFQSLQSLFPALAQRSQAKRANDFAAKAESLQSTRREGANQSAIYQARLQGIAKERHNKQTLEDFFNAREAASINGGIALNEDTLKDLERQIGKEAALGAAAAMAGQRGVAGTGIAAQIDAAQRFRLNALDGMDNDIKTARKYNQAGNLQTLTAAAFSNLALDQSMVALDYTRTRPQRAESHSKFGALVRDAGRLVATYYGGKQAADAIDKAEGYETSYQNANALQQSALDSVYGKGVETLKTASRPDFASVVGGLRGMSSNGSFDWSQFGSSLLQAFPNQKDGNNAGMQGQDYGQLFDYFRNVGSRRSSGGKPPISGSLKFPKL